MKKVVPSERFRRELDELLAGVDGGTDPIEWIGRLGARLILQQALEDEVTEFLGRAHYERATDPVSHRNGYEPRTVITTAGPVELERPRVRNARELRFNGRQPVSFEAACSWQLQAIARLSIVCWHHRVGFSRA